MCMDYLSAVATSARPGEAFREEPFVAPRVRTSLEMASTVMTGRTACGARTPRAALTGVDCVRAWFAKCAPGPGGGRAMNALLGREDAADGGEYAALAGRPAGARGWVRSSEPAAAAGGERAAGCSEMWLGTDSGASKGGGRFGACIEALRPCGCSGLAAGGSATGAGAGGEALEAGATLGADDSSRAVVGLGGSDGGRHTFGEGPDLAAASVITGFAGREG